MGGDLQEYKLYVQIADELSALDDWVNGVPHGQQPAQRVPSTMEEWHEVSRRLNEIGRLVRLKATEYVPHVVVRVLPIVEEPECTCPGHRFAGVDHFIACCNKPHVARSAVWRAEL